MVLMDDTLILSGAARSTGRLGSVTRWGRRSAPTSSGLSGSSSSRRPCRGAGTSGPGPFPDCHLSPLRPSPRRRPRPSSGKPIGSIRKNESEQCRCRSNCGVEGPDESAGTTGRHLVVSLDGSFTNHTVFRNLPDKTVAVGRLRKDAWFYAVPVEEATPRRGRHRFYGATPFIAPSR